MHLDLSGCFVFIFTFSTLDRKNIHLPATLVQVFVEIKRRYDFAARQQQEDLVPPARQFWGSAR